MLLKNKYILFLKTKLKKKNSSNSILKKKNCPQSPVVLPNPWGPARVDGVVLMDSNTTWPVCRSFSLKRRKQKEKKKV
jgi:hypothetical protein